MVVWPFFALKWDKGRQMGKPHPAQLSGLPWSLPWGGFIDGRQPAMVRPEKFTRSLQKDNFAPADASRHVKTGTPSIVQALCLPGFNDPITDSKPMKSQRTTVSLQSKNFFPLLSIRDTGFNANLMRPTTPQAIPIAPHPPLIVEQNSSPSKPSDAPPDPSGMSPLVSATDKTATTPLDISPIPLSENDPITDSKPMKSQRTTVSLLSKIFFPLLSNRDRRGLRTGRVLRFNPHFSVSRKSHLPPASFGTALVSKVIRPIPTPETSADAVPDHWQKLSDAAKAPLIFPAVKTVGNNGTEEGSQIWLGRVGVNTRFTPTKHNLSGDTSFLGRLPFFTSIPSGPAFAAIPHLIGRGQRSELRQRQPNAGNAGPFRTAPSSRIQMIWENLETRLTNRLERKLSQQIEGQRLEPAEELRRERAASQETPEATEIWKDQLINDTMAKALLRKISTLIEEDNFRRGGIG